jgi:hypothetical protein
LVCGEAVHKTPQGESTGIHLDRFKEVSNQINKG